MLDYKENLCSPVAKTTNIGDNLMEDWFTWVVVGTVVVAGIYFVMKWMM